MAHEFIDVSPQLLSPNLLPVQMISSEDKLVDCRVLLCKDCWEVQLHTLDEANKKIRITIVNKGPNDEMCRD
jgi:hypothetical protein